MELTLKVNDQEILAILTGLQRLPEAIASPLLLKLQAQIQEQMPKQEIQQ